MTGGDQGVERSFTAGRKRKKPSVQGRYLLGPQILCQSLYAELEPTTDGLAYRVRLSTQQLNKRLCDRIVQV